MKQQSELRNEIRYVVQLDDCPVCGAFIRTRISERDEIVVEEHRNPVSHRKCKGSFKIVGYFEQI
jgi:hypothetical protein